MNIVSFINAPLIAPFFNARFLRRSQMTIMSLRCFALPINSMVSQFFKSRHYSSFSNPNGTITLDRLVVKRLIQNGSLHLKDDLALQDDPEMVLAAMECVADDRDPECPWFYISDRLEKDPEFQTRLDAILARKGLREDGNRFL